MSVKALIRCPRCQQNNITSIVGELKPTGHLVIQRFYQYQSGKFHKEYTIIGGKDFFVVCARCGTTVFFRKIRSGNLYPSVVNYSYAKTHWIQRFSGSLQEEIPSENGSKKSEMEGGTSRIWGTS